MISSIAISYILFYLILQIPSKWFQVLSKTNYSIQYYSLVLTLLNRFKHGYVIQIIQFIIIHLFAHTWIVLSKVND